MNLKIGPGSGKFVKGVSSNPGGRPKGLAALVRERTKDGKVLVDLMLTIAEGRDEKATSADKVSAIKWLAERGFGKVADQTEHSLGESFYDLILGSRRLEREQQN